MFWMDTLLYEATTTKAADQQIYALEQTNKQLQAMIPALAQSLTKSQVVAIAAEQSDSDVGVYEKEGCTWAGFVGLKFDDAGKLQVVANSWSYDDTNPCFK